MTNLLLLTLAISCAAVTQESVPQEHFQQGKQLIEANCGDCRGSTRASLERGIAEVRKALELGYPDQLGAYRLLGEAYNTLALVFAKSDSPEEKEAREQRRRAYEKILDLDPSDVESRLLYALSLRDRAEQMAQYRKILELKPDHTDALFDVGMLLVAEGRSDEGLAELRKAFDLAPGSSAEPYGRALIRVLTGLGRKQEADEIAKKLKEKLNRAEKMAQYRKILELKPDHTDALFGVGMLLVEEGRSDEGLAELRKAFDLAPGYSAEPYGEALIRVLTNLGRKQEADEIAKKLKEKLKPQRKEP